MTQATPQCPEVLYTPETDTLLRCTQSDPHDWHVTEHGTKWRDCMADQDSPQLDPFSENPADVMNRPLTPERLAEIREREQAATPGPWTAHEEWPGSVFHGGDTNLLPIARTTGRMAEANERFIAHAREDVPALLAELDRVRAERDAFADRVDTLTAVAKSNKRHVQEMHADLQEAKRERDELKKRASQTA